MTLISLYTKRYNVLSDVGYMYSEIKVIEVCKFDAAYMNMRRFGQNFKTIFEWQCASPKENT